MAGVFVWLDIDIFYFAAHGDSMFNTDIDSRVISNLITHTNETIRQ